MKVKHTVPIIFFTLFFVLLTQRGGEKPLFPRYEADRIVRITSQTGDFILTRGDSWQTSWQIILAGETWLVQESPMETLLSLPAIATKHPVGSRDSWSETEPMDLIFTDDKGQSLSLEILAPPYWNVGKEEGLLVNIKGESPIYLIPSRESLNLLPFSGVSLIDQSLFHGLRGEDIISYSLVTDLEGPYQGEYNYTLELTQDSWQVKGAAGPFVQLDPSEVTLLLLRLSQLQADLLIPKEKEHQSEVRFSLVLQTKKGKIYKLAVGKQIISLNDQSYYQVTGESDSHTYLLSQNSLAQVAPPLRDILQD